MNNKFKNLQIEEFDESDLFGEGLTEKQIERTKKKMMKIVKEVNEVNKELNINITLSEILKIKEDLGEDAEKIEFGVKHARILKKIVLDAIDKDIKSKNLDIVDELFVPSPVAIQGRADTLMLHDSTYFYKIYLTKDSLITYSLNDRYKLVKTRTLLFSEIHSIGKAVQSKGWWGKGTGMAINTFNGCTSFIEPHSKETIYLNHLYNGYEKDVLSFIDRLCELSGIQYNKNLRFDMTDKFTLITNIGLAIFLVLFIIRFILNGFQI